MLDDWDSGAEQRGMDGAGSVIDRIDVEGIDSDQRDAGVDELLSELAGEMRMAFEILVSPPVRVPACVNQERFPLERCKVDRQAIDCAMAALGHTDDDAIQIRERFEFQ